MTFDTWALIIYAVASLGAWICLCVALYCLNRAFKEWTRKTR